jgi:hypothetical protein
MGVGCEVLTGRSASLLLHPREFIESRNDVDAIVVTCCQGVWEVVGGRRSAGYECQIVGGGLE